MIALKGSASGESCSPENRTCVKSRSANRNEAYLREAERAAGGFSDAMEVVVDAASALVTTNPEVHFVLIGSCISLTPEIDFPKYHRPYRGFSDAFFMLTKYNGYNAFGTFTG